MRRQPNEVNGAHCVVKKHTSMGCAVISMNAVAVRQAIVAAFPDKDAKVDIGGHQVSIKAHVDKETKQDIPTDIFAGWGHKAEKNDPLPEQALADFFDKQHEEFVTRGLVTLQDPGRVLTEEEKRAIAQRTAAAQGQWAAAGGVSPLARQPAAVGLVPGTAAAAAAQAAQQAQQQQYMAAMQAQYLMRMQQQQQYLAAVQAQQAPLLEPPLLELPPRLRLALALEAYLAD